ncbi:MAG TPA: prolyl oligopeptidase family serine peptidase [Chitinophagaceae bacterium]|nr:prolyl oligopeptidase family serine peptidase [Chitinophagaceae bacterium]
MQKILFFLLCCIALNAGAQQLTVEKIMQDTKWIGTSPASPFWGYDSKTVYFKWNPEKALADSNYAYKLNSSGPVKWGYAAAQMAAAINSGVYNKNRSLLVYDMRGDIYLLDAATNTIKRITQTEEYESNPVFTNNDEWIVYRNGENLFAWNIKDGTTKQLTKFVSGGPRSGKKISEEEEFVKDEQPVTSDVIRQRKAKADARRAFLQSVKDTDTLHTIYTGDAAVTSLQINPTGRFVTYNLYERPKDAKNTIVPSYVTESGFTTDIPGRENVGAEQGSFTFYVFDRKQDTVIKINTDSLPGIAVQPLYEKDYPGKFTDKKKLKRTVTVDGPYWNDEGSRAIVDIRSNDFKDRWLMQLDGATGMLTLVDHQHDEAWIGGPGIGWLASASLGWLDENTCWFQSEETGYSHLYSVNVTTGAKVTITKGKYEVQAVQLSNDKKHFYITTNEEHPGKQQFYRINTDGNGKQQITPMDGGYEVSISPDEKYIAYRYSYQNKPWELYVQENEPGKKPIQVTDKAMSNEWKAYPWRDTKIFSFKARDGANVYARIYEPAAGKKNKAAVIFVHGAGYLQNITYSWGYYTREFMFNNLLADKGYTVMDIDYRASSGYGRDWRTGIYRHMGGKDLDDEVDAAHYLVKQYGIDSTRIGMYGGSYGGFMTLMAMFTAPGVFKAGAALRPVTDWAHYNHGYTAAILNEPFNDSIAYARSSPINFAAGLKGHLLICHGIVDENVHFQDAVRLTQRLIELHKENWSIAPFPMEDHGFTEPSSWTDEYKRILKLFDDNLLSKQH